MVAARGLTGRLGLDVHHFGFFMVMDQYII